ncbi:hypothetical protein [Mycobacterium sp. GA-2829]|uniref:hypothetical protein n=1 Tax=Mycobacterium sp. GA-2829 TaxID=1772283 RepID=UPI0007401677|nr:hypothetical protein [Mycobacterium sp. GA-2829]KUI36199.1 hypothetical protein AU194_15900 [Mycobacterium sp. GA-2829]
MTTIDCPEVFDYPDGSDDQKVSRTKIAWMATAVSVTLTVAGGLALHEGPIFEIHELHFFSDNEVIDQNFEIDPGIVTKSLPPPPEVLPEPEPVVIFLPPECGCA